MRKAKLLHATLGAVLVAVLHAAPAHAQATRTWVSGVGNDADPCSRTAPCKTFAGAISKTAAFGEINCTDPGGFGAVTITKSIAIRCPYTEAGVLVSGTNGIVVNVTSTDVVYLEGLDLLGVTTAISGPALNGISFIQAGALHVKNVVIRGFNSAAAGNGNGIKFAPTGAAELYVTDSYIADNGSGANGSGILVQGAGSGVFNVMVKNTNVHNNPVGIQGNGTGSTGGVLLSVFGSSASGSSFAGVAATQGGGAPVAIMVDSSNISGNAGSGLTANGASAIVRVARSSITNNNTSISNVGGGTVVSYNDNNIDGNTVNTLPATIMHH